MKGRTTCPKCKHQFILELNEDEKEPQTSCPKCNHNFKINTNCEETPNGSTTCTWEEHGEPRKTILSSMKPKSNRPMIAIILLICIFSIGVTTAIFSETFIETTLDVADSAGLKGSVTVEIQDVTNNTIESAEVLLNGKNLEKNDEGLFFADEVKPGIQTIKVSKSGYNTEIVEILVTPFFKSAHVIKLENGTISNENIKEFDTIGCSIIILIFAVFTLISLITTLQRQHFDAALMGAILSIFTFGFFFLGSILSIAAVIVIYFSRDEFENGKKGKIF